jgi:single-stranded-DNA-specific exonuclease
LAEQKVAVLEVCGDLPLDEVNDRFVRQMRFFGPFGPENMEPVFVAKGVEVRDMRILKEAHLKLELRQGGTQLEAIGFGLAERWHQVNAKWIDIAYQPGFKSYKGRTSIQLRIKDIRKSQGQ